MDQGDVHAGPGQKKAPAPPKPTESHSEQAHRGREESLDLH